MIDMKCPWGISALVGALAIWIGLTANSWAEQDAEQAIAASIREFYNGDKQSAIAAMDKILAESPNDARAVRVRGRMHEELRDFEKAIADYGHWIMLDSKPWEPLNNRGSVRFKAGDVKGSIADFDRAIEFNAGLEQSHWQRGLSYYYAGRFKEGDQQFGLYQSFQSADVENVAWRMACQARYLGFEKAQQQIMRLGGPDHRVPMRQIYELFRGKGSTDAVFDAAKAGKSNEKVLKKQMFYAHLYVGLYLEIKGDQAKARHHILAADKRQIDDYMWYVAHVHAAQLSNKPVAANTE